MKKGMKLKSNFLNQVIFRIEFPTIKELLGKDSDVATDFAERISEKFPILEVIPRNKINLDIDINSGQPQKITKEGNIVWMFKSEKNKKIVTLTANDLVLEYRDKEYPGFPIFLEEIQLLINAFNQYDYQKLKFLGLRYINQITDMSVNENIGEYFNPDLTNMSILNNLEKNDEDLVQIFSKVNSKHDDYLLTMQYGLFNPRFPNVDSDKLFILDYDCVLHNINSTEEIKDKLNDMHEVIFNKFDYSITPKFEKLINGDE